MTEHTEKAKSSEATRSTEPTVARAAAPGAATAVTPVLDMIGMVTADMGAALAFYRRLGLEFPAHAEREPHVEAQGLPGGVRIAWDTVEVMRATDPQWRFPTGENRLSLAFHCGSPAGVDAVHQELVAAGHGSERAPWDAFWGQRYAVVLDPDGNCVDLFAPLG